MKTIFLPLFFILCLQASAQSMRTAIQYNKTSQQGLLLYLPYSPDVAEGAILAKLKELGVEPETTGPSFWKQNKVNGFYVFKGITLKGNQPQIVDLYFKVERRGDKKEAQSVMYLLVSKGGENFVNDATNAAAFTAGQTFLNGFVTETASYKHILEVQAQEEAVKKAEKKLTDLQAAEIDLSKKLTLLQEDIRKNKEAQESQKADIDDRKKKLEEMKQ